MNAVGVGIVLVYALEEMERKKQNRDLHRRLRDASDPFSLPEENFRRLYRFTREVCRDLFLEIEPFLKENKRKCAIPKIIKMFTALHFFAHGSYQKSVGKDYHSPLSQASVSRCINDVINVIDEHLSARYIKFPTTRNEMDRVKRRFFQKFNFSGIVGAIDCTHIAIVAPPAEDPNFPGYVFINRKNFHSINCQILCDSDLKIIGINARFPGSVHDAAIWMGSSVNQLLENNFRNGDRNTWLLGDSGYPLQPYLLTPIIGADPATPEGRYTKRHCRARNAIERCIGVLKGYFRCLHKDRALHCHPLTSAKIINCCAVLHNILVERRIHDLHLDVVDAVNNIDDININEIHGNNLLEEGRNVRALYIRNNC